MLEVTADQPRGLNVWQGPAELSECSFYIEGSGFRV